MNGNSIVLDTTIILYLLNGDDKLALFLNKMKLFDSIISEIEWLACEEIANDEKIKICNFLSECTIVILNLEIKNSCIASKQTIKNKAPDVIIATPALYFQIPLITSDKGFERIQNLDLSLDKN